MQLAAASNGLKPIGTEELHQLTKGDRGALYSLHILPELCLSLDLLLEGKPEIPLYSQTEAGVLILHPEGGEPIRVLSPNGIRAWMTPVAAGTLSAILAYSSLAYSNSKGLCLFANTQLESLKSEAKLLPEWPVIKVLLS